MSTLVPNVYDDDGVCSIDLQWNIIVLTNMGSITFETCTDGLVADGISTAKAWLDIGTLTPDITWSIDPPTLGCQVIDPTNFGCIVRAGETPGTVYVRATDANGCYTRARLDLIDPDEPNCGGTCGPEDEHEIGDGDAGLGSVEASFSLGKSRNGQHAGALQLLANEPSADMYTPKSLAYRWRRGDVAVVTNQDGAIRQVKAPQGLANVVVSNSSLYTISFYRPNEFGVKTTNGYPLIGNPTPFAVWTVENPDTNTTNRLKITHAPVNQSSVVHEYRWLTNGWEVDSGSGLRVKSRTYSYVTNEGEFAYYKAQTTTTRSAGGGTVAQHTRKWYVDGPDEELIEETWGTGANPRTNSYRMDYSAEGQPGLVVRWDGSWNWYLYDSGRRLVTNFSSYLNQTITNNPALCRMTIYDYSTNILSGSGDAGIIHPFGPRSETDYITNQPVSKRYYVYLPGEHREIQCLDTNAAWNDSANLVTITKTYTNTIFSGRTRSVKRPDGTMDIYYYSTADYTSSSITNQQNVTNIVMSGKPDGYETNIVDGTKTTTVTGPLGQVYSRITIDIVSGIVIASETYSEFDPYDRARKVTHLDGTWSYTDYACCGAQTVTNREGIVTTYTRDALKRVIASTETTGAGSITTSNHYDAAGNVLTVTRTGGGSTITYASSTYDLAGRKLTSQDGLGNTTRYAESLPPLVLSTTNADGGTSIESRFRDGQVASTTGTAAFPMRYEYGAVLDGGIQRAFTKEIKLDSGGSDTSEYLTNFVDAAGRSYKIGFAGSTGPNRQSWFNNKGQLWKERDPDGVITLYTNNARGELEYTCIDSNQNDIIDFDGQDRITRTTNEVVSSHSTDVFRTLTALWLTDGSSTGTPISSTERSVDGLKTWQTNAGVQVSYSVKTAPSAGSWTVTQTAADGSYSITLYQNGRVASVTRYSSGDSPIGQTSYGYDAYGRQNAVTDARTGTTTYTFNNADQIVSVSSPPPGTGAAAQTTTSYFDQMGRATNIVQPDGTSVINVFSKRGELLLSSGSRNYPVGYSYDAQGRIRTMTNWSTFSSSTGARVTTWHYDALRGWQTNKVYDDGKGTKYSYTDAGRLNTRLWARGTNTTYSYNNFGDLSSVSYNDGATPTLSYTYTRRGQQDKITRGSDSWRLFYNTAGQLLSEAGTAGALNGLRVTNGFDEFLRRTNVSSADGATLLTTNGYTHDTAGRLSTARDGTYLATYSYLANSPLVSQVEFKSNSTVRLTATKTYDSVNRLQKVSSVPSASSTLTYAYSYNAANQRTRVNLADGSFWVYEYDSLGQVKSGKRYWSDWTPVAGQQYEYSFDDIGNRSSTKAGGDSIGGNLRSASYSNNTLNQITGRDVPGYLNVIGVATARATNVNVNNIMAYRLGEYYRVELNPDNTSAAVWQNVTNRAVQNGTTNSVTGHLFLPKHAEVFAYDADGNLTNDGRWMLAWDAENQIIKAESHSSAPTTSKRKVEFARDWRGVLIRRIEYNGSSGSYVVANDLKFLTDSLHCIAELNGTNNALIRSYLWGLDLSGTMTGAGRVGGLLTVNSKANGAHLPAFDGNGNVTGLINAADGSISARYDYSAFGERLRATGPMASENVYCFSTKRYDSALELVLYEFRPLKPDTGAWLSRDPLGEKGARRLEKSDGFRMPNRFDSIAGKRSGRSLLQSEELNLYVFVENGPTIYFDIDGRQTPPNAGKGALPSVSYPHQPIGCSLTCCDDDKIKEGKSTLRSRYFQAVQAAAALGLKPVEPPNNGPTCKNSSRDVIDWLLPYPPCWYCYLEERDWNLNDASDKGYDHQVIICNSYNSLGHITGQMMFDWWGQATWGLPYGDQPVSNWVISSKYHSPNQMQSPKHYKDCQGFEHGATSPKGFDRSRNQFNY